MNKILKKIEDKIGISGITNRIDNSLSGSELNSFLMKLFLLRIKKIRSADLITQFQKNRFCLPSSVDLIKFKEYELMLLKSSAEQGFYSIQLSPLTPLGTCSSVAFVNQNNIVSSLRGTEVVSDAANVLAIKTACDIQSKNLKNPVKYCTCHRHVRGQAFTNPAFSSHFGIFCMTTGGFDKGNFSFEIEQLMDHIKFYFNELIKTFKSEDILLKLYLDEDRKDFIDKVKLSLNNLFRERNLKIEYSSRLNNYYQAIQFKYFIMYKNELINLADGGIVDWLQKLLDNKKLRLIISGLGTELSYKIINGLV